VGADNDKVVVMRGLPGSILGYSIHDVELTGCVNSKSELTLVEVGKSAPSGCKTLMVSDLKQTGREQVQKGLPPDSLDKARGSMKVLAQNELLPPCPKKESVPQPGVLPPEQTPVIPGGSPTPAPGQPGTLPGTPSSAPTPGPDQPATPTTTNPAPTTTTVPPTTPQISGENCRVTD
jgi:protein phosphatase